MTREDFLQKLAAELRLTVSERVIAEQLAYYDEYISEEMRRGRTEEEVIGELEDPRLLARTIAEAAEAGGDRVAMTSPFRTDAEEKREERWDGNLGAEEQGASWQRGRPGQGQGEGGYPFSQRYKGFHFTNVSCLVVLVICVLLLAVLFVVAEYLLIYFAPMLAVLVALWFIKKIIDKE